MHRASNLLGIPQKEIADLLLEVSKIECSPARIQEIRDYLAGSVTQAHETWRNAYSQFIGYLIDDAVNQDRAAWLPLSFMAIARLCGERKNSRCVCVNVDYSVMEKMISKMTD